MCDCEPARVFNEVIRKARKPHKCRECWQVINPGDRYLDGNYLHDDQWTNHKVCLDCDALSKWLLQELDCCYELGGVFSECINSDLIQQKYPDDRNNDDCVSNHPDLEVVSQKPLLIRLKSKEVQNA